jgi:hypothetical protein
MGSPEAIHAIFSQVSSVQSDDHLYTANACEHVRYCALGFFKHVAVRALKDKSHPGHMICIRGMPSKSGIGRKTGLELHSPPFGTGLQMNLPGPHRVYEGV